MISQLNQWFVAEILLHEAALTRYLRRRWLAAEEVFDLGHGVTKFLHAED